MSVSGTNVRNDFTGNGVTTVFAFTFKATLASWVKVTLAGVLQGAGFTVALNADQDVSPGGTVTFAAAPGAVAVGVYRQIPLTLGTSLSAYSPFPAKTIEHALDEAVMRAQELDQEIADLRLTDPTAVAIDKAAEASVAAAVASASETSASASAATATGASSTALAAKTAAEAARDAAATAGATYVDTATGIAAVADGAYFYVPAGDTLIRYRRSGAAAVEVGRLPSAATVSGLQAALTPAASDASSGLFYITDSVGRVVAWFDSAAGLRLAGIDGTAQARLAAIQQAPDAGASIYYILDAYNRVIAYFDSAAGLNLAGLTGTVQALLATAGAKADLATREQGAVGGTIALPASFTTMSQPLRGQERFIWSGSPPTLRPNSTRFTGYPFDWTTDPVAPSAVRRVRATLAAPTTWSYEALTVNAPGGFFTNRQFRDISWLYDRKNGKYWFALNAISSQATGFKASDFPIFSSTNGTTLDYVGLVNVIPGAPDTIWSPEFFIDDEGTVYIIVCANTGAGGAYAYHLIRCTDTDTFNAWSYVGALTGSSFPTNGSGVINMIDPWMFKRDGVYYVCWKQETAAGGSSLLGQLGIACSPTLLGPYNTGHAFVAPGSVAIRGEGGNAVELPAGSAFRFRYFFDNYLGLFAGSQCYADTNDFITFTSPANTALATYSRHTTLVVGD